MTQRQLGDAVGVSQAYIAMIEAGSRKIVTRALLAALAKALSVPVGNLAGPDIASADPDQLFHDAIGSIRGALDGADRFPDRSVEVLDHATHAAQRARMACDYPELARLLPGLIADTYSLAERDSNWLAASLHVKVCVTAAIAVRSLGYLDLAMRFATRAQSVASLADDAVLGAAADFTVAQACLAGGLPNQQVRSLMISESASARIGSLATDDARVWYGMTHLQAALSAAALNRPADAAAHVAEARDAAATTPGDDWLQDFSTANVSIWELAIALEDDDPSTAVAAVAAADLAGLRTRQRQARFYGDAGRAYARARRFGEATAMFLTAMDLSAADVRARPVVRASVAKMFMSGHRGPRLHALITRLGIDPLGLDEL